MTYWEKRQQEEQERILNAIIFSEDEDIQKIYLATSTKLLDELIVCYAKIVHKGGVDGVNRTTLYEYNRYYKLFAMVQGELEKMGKKINTSLLNCMEQTYKESTEYVEKKLGIKQTLPNIDKRAKEAVNSIWAGDGKRWSDRIWQNTAKLQQKLMFRLTTAVSIGEGTVKLEQELMQEFSVSYSQAKRLVVTELAHIYNTAALDRMAEAGIEKWKFLTAKDEKVCPICGGLADKVFPIKDRTNMPPDGTHANCRCTVLAVIERKPKVENTKNT